MRMITGLFLLVVCLLQAGCLLPWIRAGYQTVEAAKAAEGIIRNPPTMADMNFPSVDPMDVNRQTADELDRILAENPDAGNAEELRRLQQAMDRGEALTTDPADRGDIVYERFLSDHDRRQPWVSDEAKPMSTFLPGTDPAAVGAMDRKRQIAGVDTPFDEYDKRVGIQLDVPDTPDQRPRSRDMWRFTWPTNSDLTPGTDPIAILGDQRPFTARSLERIYNPPAGNRPKPGAGSGSGPGTGGN